MRIIVRFEEEAGTENLDEATNQVRRTLEALQAVPGGRKVFSIDGLLTPEEALRTVPCGRRVFPGGRMVTGSVDQAVQGVLQSLFFCEKGSVEVRVS